MKKISRIFTSLFVVAVIGFAAVPSQIVSAVDPLTLCVGVAPCYSTIQSAIDAAAPGDTINVAAGNYIEDVVVNKSVSLVGAGAESTKIIATNGNQTPLTFSGSGATVIGFTMTHEYSQPELDAWTFSNAGVSFYGNGNRLENCVVTLNRNGVFVYNSQNNIITGNTITNNRTGINFTYDVSGLEISNNLISDNWTLGIVTYGPGPDFSTLSITGNTFNNNWYTEVLIKDSTGTGTLNLEDNIFTDMPVTYTTSSDPGLNEPGFSAQKPDVEGIGGTALKPDVDLPTIRIFNSPAAGFEFTGKTLAVGTGGTYSTIQAAIDAASSEDTIYVYPGNYYETASNRLLFNNSGPYQFGLFFPDEKPGITIQGVHFDGSPITSKDDLDLPYVTTNATNSFGTSGLFVEGDNITISGIKVGPNTPGGDNKTIEVIGDNFTLENSVISVPEQGGSLYLNDWRFDKITQTSHLMSYTVDGNFFQYNTSIDISSGAGFSGDDEDRKIINNVFDAKYSTGETGEYVVVSFNGFCPAVGWFVDPVGGAVIEGNVFSNGTQYIRTRCIPDDSQFDWGSYWVDNTFDKAVVTGPDPINGNVSSYSYGSFSDVRRIGTSVQYELANALPNDKILVGIGTYLETGQIIINKNVSIIGMNKNTTIIKPASDTGNSGDNRGWFLVTTGNTFNLSNLTLDGEGKLVNIGILSHGPGTIEDTIIRNISYNASGPDYAGRGIAFWNANMTIRNNLLQNIGRIGVYMNGASVTAAVIDGNTYVGKGIGNWLDYGFEIEAGAVAEISDNNVSNCKGIASADGSGSAGMLITTYWSPGASANVRDNIFDNNDVAISVGYDETDTSNLFARHNQFTQNNYGIYSTNPLVDAKENWWGSILGPYTASNEISSNVSYIRWCGDPICSFLVGQTTPVSPTGSYTSWDQVFHWTDSTNPENFIIEVIDAVTEEVVQVKWINAIGVCSESNCQIAIPGMAFKQNGDYKWRVRNWRSSVAYGEWSDYMDFTLNIQCNILTTSISQGLIRTKQGYNCPGGFTNGTFVKVIAVPTVGYGIDRWSGDATTRNNWVYLTMNSDKSLTANLKQVAILVSPTGIVNPWTNVFSWNERPTATTYRLEVFNKSGSTIIGQYWVSAAGNCSTGLCQFSPSALQDLPAGEYKWRVYDFGSYGQGLPTLFMRFKVQ